MSAELLERLVDVKVAKIMKGHTEKASAEKMENAVFRATGVHVHRQPFARQFGVPRAFIEVA